MKSKSFVLILFAAAMVSGISSFYVTRHRICAPSNGSCKIKTFQAEALVLADMLESKTSSNDQIINQARKVFSIRQDNIVAAAHQALKTDTGRQTVLDLIPCPVDSNQTKTDSASGFCCIGPGCCCEFDTAQSRKLAQSDPNFLKASIQFGYEIGDARKSLASMLNDRAVPDETIIKTLRDYLEKNNALEIRAVEYFVSIKPHLTADQQKQIFCWCAQQIRNRAQTGAIGHN